MIVCQLFSRYGNRVPVGIPWFFFFVTVICLNQSSAQPTEMMPDRRFSRVRAYISFQAKKDGCLVDFFGGEFFGLLELVVVGVCRSCPPSLIDIVG
jgi:hypothetical protein